MPRGKLKGRVALVTGAAQGIGKGCALCLAEEGADIALNDLPGRLEAASAAAGEIEQLGRRTMLVAGDMGLEADIDRAVTAALDHFGRIDILLSNVAYEVHASALDLPRFEVRRTLDVTLAGALYLAQLAARHMIERGGGGKIIFITSIHGEVPFAGAIAYNAAKAGVNHLARSLANELARYRINVNAIAPGWIDTPGERRWYSEEQLRNAAGKLPWGRLGTPLDIGRAAVYLASEDADYVTGAVLKVDGGLTASLGQNLE